MNKKQKGEFAQLKVQQRALEKGWICSVPTSVERYDLIIDDRQKLFKTQIKYIDGKCKNCDGAVKATVNNGPGSPLTYTAEEIDLILAYLPSVNKIVAMSPEHFVGKTALQIRIAPTKNNQSKGVFFAEDHIW